MLLKSLLSQKYELERELCWHGCLPNYVLQCQNWEKNSWKRWEIKLCTFFFLQRCWVLIAIKLAYHTYLSPPCFTLCSALLLTQITLVTNPSCILCKIQQMIFLCYISWRNVCIYMKSYMKSLNSKIDSSLLHYNLNTMLKSFVCHGKIKM